MKPYTDGDSKKEQVTRMFDGIAPEYDKLDHILSFNIDRLWRRKTAKMVRRTDARRILDVAAGTADLTIVMARKIPGAQITGADISEGMLEVGRKKAAKRKLEGNIEFIRADAENLPFARNSFDTVTAAFGVRNFQDIDAGLQEMHRVLSPGGGVFILEFSMPEGKIFGPLYRFYFRRILPVIGGIVSKDYKAYEYLPGSVGEFPSGERFLQLLEHAGFRECSARRLTRGIAQIYSGKKE